MSYFGGSSRMAGDPGFFDTLKRIGRGVLGFATGGPVGAATSLFTPPRGIAQNGIPVIAKPGIKAGIQRAIPGGATGLIVGPDGLPMRKRRRMNPGNAKALRRAIRRTDAFVRLSRSALKNTGFKIVSKSSGKVSRATMDKAVAAAHHRGS